MRLLLIVNASASAVTARARVVVQKALSSGNDVAYKETNRRGHAARLAQGAAADGIGAVVVLGGDGTMNEAANGLAGSATALAALPGGSTNVFARTIGMANDPVEAAGQLVAALAAGSVHRVGLGMANGRYFLFHAGIGFDAAVVARVERWAYLKRYTGPAVFAAAAFATWARGYGRTGPAFSVTPEHAPGRHVPAGPLVPVRARFGICLNTDPYTFLGKRPVRVVPETSLATELSMATFGEVTPACLLPALVAALHRGIGESHGGGAQVMRGLESVTIKADRPVPYQLDGDYVGSETLIELRWCNDAIGLVKPLG